MSDSIQTARLTLRRFKQDDIADITAVFRDVHFAQMIPRLPWPYGEEDARMFVTDVAPAEALTFAIDLDGQLVGSISAHNQLGYWIARPAWGAGFACEASKAVLDLRFAQDPSDVPSGHRIGNAASRAVLTKLGFTDTTRRRVHCNADDCEVTMQDMGLSKQKWEARQ